MLTKSQIMRCDSLDHALRRTGVGDQTVNVVLFKPRIAHRLADRLIDYERQLEWLEGLAKYAELEAWRRASKTADYRPLPALANDPEFGRYAGFDQKWSRELSEMKQSAGREDTRFYYSGMAQAVALDRLMPTWKARAFADCAWLETLLAEAVAAE